MNLIFNSENFFYYYFPHIPALRMKREFGMEIEKRYVSLKKWIWETLDK